jgi:hypothetical protein
VYIVADISLLERSLTFALCQVDMRKVNLQVIRPWIAKKVVELIGFEDEVAVEYTMGLLEDKQQPVRPIYIQDWSLLLTLVPTDPRS